MRTFLALYRGATVGSAELVAVSADPEVVTRFADEILRTNRLERDPVLGELEGGRRRALQVVRDEQVGGRGR
jgi:hypothetical protein